MISVAGLITYISSHYNYLRNRITGYSSTGQQSNSRENTKMYSMKFLKKHIRNLEQYENSQQPFLIWFPRCNYDADRYNILYSGKVFYQAYKINEFKSSIFLFRDHLYFCGLEDDYMLELTPTEEKFLCLDKIEFLASRINPFEEEIKITEANYKPPIFFNLSITDFNDSEYDK